MMSMKKATTTIRGRTVPRIAHQLSNRLGGCTLMDTAASLSWGTPKSERVLSRLTSSSLRERAREPSLRWIYNWSLLMVMLFTLPAVISSASAFREISSWVGGG